MALTHFNRGSWQSADFHRASNTSVAIMACGGPSLNKVDCSLLHGPKKVVFGLNNVYPRVYPDVWAGMDDPHCYDRDIFFEPFIKILRAGYEQRTYNGVKLFKAHNVYYANMKKGKGVYNIFTDLTQHGGFVWHQNSFATMLNIILWMGHREIYIAGSDFSNSEGDYWDSSVSLTGAHQDWNSKLYDQLSVYLYKFSLLCEPLGIKLYSMSPDSSINTYLTYVSIEDLNKKLYSEMPEKTPKFHALELDAPKQ